MLFSPGSKVALFLAFGLLILGVVACLGPGLAPLAEEGILWALLVMSAVALPAALNLWRYERAPLGCAVIPLSFLLGGLAVWLARPPWEQALALALPNLGFLGAELLLRPLLRERRLVVVGSHALPAPRRFHLVTRPTEQLSGDALALRDWLIARLASWDEMDSPEA